MLWAFALSAIAVLAPATSVEQAGGLHADSGQGLHAARVLAKAEPSVSIAPDLTRSPLVRVGEERSPRPFRAELRTSAAYALSAAIVSLPAVASGGPRLGVPWSGSGRAPLLTTCPSRGPPARA